MAKQTFKKKLTRVITIIIVLLIAFATIISLIFPAF
ncbi:MAG: hypothetical protein MNSN_09400 [Minisyncoccus archaeiphilus]|nr:MAG: hypothetical protein MNSN_09400 [Candidatus Parcubacteria bacterium]